MRNALWSMVVGGIVGALLWTGPVGAQPFPGGLPRCLAELAKTTAELEACRATAEQLFPATGQTSCWDPADTTLPIRSIACTGTGQDGDIQAGATLSYTDNRDGTITDNNTDLVWEKKSDDGMIHDKDTTYLWADAFAVHIAGLNTAPCFAGFCDWRLPNVKELLSIVNYENGFPAISSEFNSNCTASCGVTTCSYTAAGEYGSSTSFAADPSAVWLVNFSNGFTGLNDKISASPFHVRAVRGGR